MGYSIKGKFRVKMVVDIEKIIFGKLVYIFNIKYYMKNLKFVVYRGYW